MINKTKSTCYHYNKSDHLTKKCFKSKMNNWTISIFIIKHISKNDLKTILSIATKHSRLILLKG